MLALHAAGGACASTACSRGVWHCMQQEGRVLALHAAGGACASTACSRGVWHCMQQEGRVLALHAAGGACASTASSRWGVCFQCAECVKDEQP